MKIEKMF